MLFVNNCLIGVYFYLSNRIWWETSEILKLSIIQLRRLQNSPENSIMYSLFLFLCSELSLHSDNPIQANTNTIVFFSENTSLACIFLYSSLMNNPYKRVVLLSTVLTPQYKMSLLSTDATFSIWVSGQWMSRFIYSRLKGWPFCFFPQILWRFSTAWYGTVRFGTVHFWGVFHWVLYLVPGTFFSTFLVPPQPRFQAIRTVTKTWRVNSADHWLAGENRHYCITELATRDPPLQPDPLDLNQHSQRWIGCSFFSTNAPFCINRKMSVSLSVEEEQTFLSLIAEERIQRELYGATPKVWTCYIIRVCLLFIFLPLYLCFASIKNNLIE